MQPPPSTVSVPPLMLILGAALLFIAAVASGAASAPSPSTPSPAASGPALSRGTDPLRMQPLGVYCGGAGGDTLSQECGETTPIMWPPSAPTLAMVEHHSSFRIRFQAFNGTGNNSLLCPMVPGSDKVAFVSATVVNDTLWLFGTNDVEMPDGGKPRTQVIVFWSSDPLLSNSSWQNKRILQLPQNGTRDPSKASWDVPWYTAFNTSPARGRLPSKLLLPPYRGGRYDNARSENVTAAVLTGDKGTESSGRGLDDVDT